MSDHKPFPVRRLIASHAGRDSACVPASPLTLAATRLHSLSHLSLHPLVKAIVCEFITPRYMSTQSGNGRHRSLHRGVRRRRWLQQQQQQRRRLRHQLRNHWVQAAARGERSPAAVVAAAATHPEPATCYLSCMITFEGRQRRRKGMQTGSDDGVKGDGGGGADADAVACNVRPRLCSKCEN